MKLLVEIDDDFAQVAQVTSLMAEFKQAVELRCFDYLTQRHIDLTFASEQIKTANFSIVEMNVKDAFARLRKPAEPDVLWDG